jgi:hypothetical protein
MEDDLRIRRALGFKLESAGRLLPQFLDYLESVGAETITPGHAVRWATLPSAANPIWWGMRLTVVVELAISWPPERRAADAKGAAHRFPDQHASSASSSASWASASVAL